MKFAIGTECKCMWRTGYKRSWLGRRMSLQKGWRENGVREPFLFITVAENLWGEAVGCT